MFDVWHQRKMTFTLNLKQELSSPFSLSFFVIDCVIANTCVSFCAFSYTLRTSAVSGIGIDQLIVTPHLLAWTITLYSSQKHGHNPTSNNTNIRITGTEIRLFEQTQRLVTWTRIELIVLRPGQAGYLQSCFDRARLDIYNCASLKSPLGQ